MGWREEEGKEGSSRESDEGWIRAPRLNGGRLSRTAGTTEGMGEGGMGPRIREDNGRGAKGMDSRICGNDVGVGGLGYFCGGGGLEAVEFLD